MGEKSDKSEKTAPPPVAALLQSYVARSADAVPASNTPSVYVPALHNRCNRMLASVTACVGAKHPFSVKNGFASNSNRRACGIGFASDVLTDSVRLGYVVMQSVDPTHCHARGTSNHCEHRRSATDFER